MKGRNLLMIPGPVEFSPSVTEAFSRPTDSHVSPSFINTFGEALEKMKRVWMAPDGHPFILAGSGTLAMDSTGSNLVEPGDRVLVISSGYFGNRYADLLKRYGAVVTEIAASPGSAPDMSAVEDEIKKGGYSLMTFTHVDTSTAVRVDPVPVGELGKKYGVITVLDGVCSVAAEEIHQQAWGIDVVLTASQKAVGVPPGLALMVASERAVEKWKNRKSPVGNYYGDWNNWMPVMTAYLERKPSYFGTPAVNLVEALNVSLTEILSAPYYPEGVDGPSLLKEVAAHGVTLAGGLHPANRQKYFRIGHMGVASVNDLVSTVTAIGMALNRCGYKNDTGAAVNALISGLG
jgi:alanine-glyoxylate transaminase/serine-glyoxylate transaminase/serine-pyruvate transaminase